jgi:hypothetical protein
MGFHIDATDRAHAEEATDFDFRTGASGSFGYGPWSASASMSIAYVRSTRADSDSQLNVETDLTGEVEIHFKSDYFPIQRFADAAHIGAIQGNTAVPSANVPVTEEKIEWGKSEDVEKRQRVTAGLPARSTTLRPGGGTGEPPKLAVQVPQLPSWNERKEAKEQDKKQEQKPDEAAKPTDATKTDEAPKPPVDANATKPEEAAKPPDSTDTTTAPPPQPGAADAPAAVNTTVSGGGTA